MEADFPAAHSMDSEWFAVDQEGNIAIFETQEAGIIPDTAEGADQGSVYGVLDQFSSAFNLPEFHDMDDEVLTDERLNILGVFHYVHDDYQGEPYDRRYVPRNPRKLKDLPAELQSIFGSVRFVDFKFSEMPQIFPRRYFACIGWGDDLE